MLKFSLSMILVYGVLVILLALTKCSSLPISKSYDDYGFDVKVETPVIDVELSKDKEE